jgi:hypothetical protein
MEAGDRKQCEVLSCGLGIQAPGSVLEAKMEKKWAGDSARRDLLQRDSKWLVIR